MPPPWASPASAFFFSASPSAAVSVSPESSKHRTPPSSTNTGCRSSPTSPRFRSPITTLTSPSAYAPSSPLSGSLLLPVSNLTTRPTPASTRANRQLDSPYGTLGVNLSSIMALIVYYQSDRTSLSSQETAASGNAERPISLA